MKKYFGKLIIAGLCVLMATLSIHININQAMAGSKPKTLTLGALTMLSGGMATYGQDEERCLILAMEEINAKGGITVAGERYIIDLVILDDKYKTAETIAGLNRLVDLHNVHFVHVFGATPCMAALKYNEEKKVLLGMTTNYSGITQTGNRLALSSTAQTNGYDWPLAKEALKRGLRKMVIIADNKEFGKGQAASMAKLYKQFGGEVVRTEYVDTMQSTDFYPVCTKLKAIDCDFIFVAAADEGSGRIAKQFREVGYKGLLAFTSNFQKPGINIAGIGNVEGSLLTASPNTLIGLAPPGTPERYIQWRERFFKRWPDRKSFQAAGASAYNWLYYITRAIEIAGTTTDPYPVREAANKAVAENDYLLGVKGFTKGGRGYGTMLYLMEIRNGEPHVLGEYPYPEELAAEGEK